MKHIMIHHEEKIDVKCVTEIVYAPTVAKKTIVCRAGEYRYASMENVEDDVLYAIQIVKSYVLAAKVLLVVKNVVKNVLAENCRQDAKYTGALNCAKLLIVRQEA